MTGTSVLRCSQRGADPFVLIGLIAATIMAVFWPDIIAEVPHGLLETPETPAGHL